MYTFFIDKSETFKCQLSIEGANLTEASARLVIKDNDTTLLFEGEIEKDGMCNVPLKNLKRYLKEGNSGDVILEVIVDGTYFTPWKDTYELKVEKKVEVEVLSNNKKQMVESNIKVNATPTVASKPKIETKPNATLLEQRLQTHSTALSQYLSQKGIRRVHIKDKKELVKEIVKVYLKKLELDLPLTDLLRETLYKIK